MISLTTTKGSCELEGEQSDEREHSISQDSRDSPGCQDSLAILTPASGTASRRHHVKFDCKNENLDEGGSSLLTPSLDASPKEDKISQSDSFATSAASKTHLGKR